MNSKQRAYLRKISAMEDSIFHVGKYSVTPEVTAAIEEAFNTREIIKISILKNCADDPKIIAQIISERTHSTVVHVIGRKVVLYKPAKEEKDRKIILP